MAQPRTFGFVPWQAIVGTVQAAALGASSLTQKNAINKYLKSQTHTVERSHQDALSLKQAQFASREQSLQTSILNEDDKSQQIKKLIVISVISVIALTCVGLFSYSIISREKNVQT